MVHEKLLHLNADEIDSLIERYCEGDEPVSVLVAEYGIDIQPSRLASILPPQESEELCPYCEVRLVCKVKSRSSYSTRDDRRECPQCGHGKREPCRCSNCRQNQAAIAAYEAEVRQEAINSISRPQPFDTQVTLWGFRTALYVLSLSRHSLSENYEMVFPYDDKPVSLAPTPSKIDEVVTHLYRGHHIGIDSSSPHDAFTYTEGNEAVHRFYPARVTWGFLPGIAFEQRRFILAALENVFRSGDWPDAWYEDVDRVWREVVQSECLEYFLHLMEQRGFDANSVDDRVEDVIDRALNHFAPAQVCNLLWQSARDCVDFMATKGIPRRQAQAVCRGIFDRKIDKHVAEKWIPRHSRRDFACPQSAVSSCLFNSVLELGSDAFNSVPPPLPK